MLNHTRKATENHIDLFSILKYLKKNDIIPKCVLIVKG